MKKKLCRWMIGITAAAFLLAACGDKETTAPAEDSSTEEEESEADATEEEPSDAPEESAADATEDEDTENPDDSDTALTEEEYNELMAQWEETGEIPEKLYNALMAQWEETGEIPDEFRSPSFPEPTCPYIGLTISEILDEGFRICGYGSISGESSYQIMVTMQKDYATLNLYLNVDSEIFNAYQELDSDGQKEFIFDHFSEEKATDSSCDFRYDIYTKSQLEACAADGNCIREESMEGKTYGELMAEGYQESDMIGSVGDEYFIKFCDEDYKQGYIIMLDLTEKGEDVDTFGFWSDVEPRLSDYTVMAAYAIK